MKVLFAKQCFQRNKLSILDVACGLLLSTISIGQSAIAAPQGGEVVGGQGSITTPSSSLTQIQQSSQNMVIDWQSFNVDANELVQFSQPSSTSAVLNRINDISPSEIYGSIDANGLVFLMNPNGILFGEGAHIQVNGLFATNLEIDPSRFMSGDYAFESMGMINGMIVNRGVISASTGGVSLVSDTGVVNEGQILATVGSINLAVAKTATLDFSGDGMLQLSVSGDVLDNAQALDDAVKNTGEIIAEGGDVLLSGQVARDVFTNVVNNTGVIKATRVINEGGVITLAGPSGDISNSGTLDVSGTEAGEVVVTAVNITHSGLIDASATKGDGGSVTLQSSGDTLLQGQSVITAQADNGTGGTVHVLGDRVGLFDESSINASGKTGGGEVLIGGDFQGKNIDVQNASQTYVGPNTSISADATDEGNGGKVIVWADERTQYYGDISVQGGQVSGNGGFVEVSGKNILNFAGTVDTTAVNGNSGTLLLDPLDITINDAATGVNDIEVTDNNSILFAEPDGATSYTISETTLEGLSGNVILQAQQDIILSDLTTDGVLDFSLVTAGSSVVFQAGRSITFANTANTIQTAGGNIHLEADSQHSAAGAADGTGALTLGLLTSNGGDITLLAAGANADADPDGFSFGGAISAGSGNVYISTSDNTAISLDADITQAGFDNITTTGNLFVGQATTAGTDGQGAGAVTEYASSITQDGSITVGTASASSFNLISTNGFAGAGGAVTLTTNQALVINGDVDANNVGDVDINGQITAGSYDISITANEISGDNDNSSPPNELTTTGTLTLSANKIGITERPINIGSVTNLIINDLGAGDIEINLNGGTAVDIGVSSNALDLANLNSVTDFTYNNTHSAVSLGTLAASGKNLTINASNGIIDATSLVTAQNLSLISGAGIGASGTPINTVADLLTITSNGGDVYISDSLAGGSNLGLLTTVAGTTEIVELTAAEGWNITQSNVNGAGGAGVGDTINLIATTGNIDRSGGTLSANSLSLDAVAGGIGIGGAIDAAANAIALSTGGAGSAGDIFFATTGAFDVATFSGAVTTAGSGQLVDLTADSWTSSAATDLSGNSVILRATTGGITIAGANTLTADAAGFSVTNSDIADTIDVSVDAGTVAAITDNGGSDSGAITINGASAGTGTVVVGSVGSVSGLTTTNADINVTTVDEHIDIQQDINAGTGAIALSATDSAATGDYNITRTGNFRITTSGVLTLTADGGIGASGTPLQTDVGTLVVSTAGASAAGDVYISDSTATTLESVVSNTTGGTSDQTIEISALSWDINDSATLPDGIGDSGDTMTITATGGDITYTAGTIVAADLTLDAQGATGGIGSTGNAVQTNAGALTLSTGGNTGIEGNIYVTDSTATVLKSVVTDASAQSIELSALSWSINDASAAGIGDAADTIKITATGGNITHTAGTIDAADLTLEATTAGIGASGSAILTNAGLLTVTSGGAAGAGDIYISDSFAGTSTLGVLTTAGATTQIVELTSANGWDITQSNVGGAGAAGVGDTLSLIATTGNIDRTAGTLTANDLTLNAVAGGIGIGAGIGLRAPVDAVANSIALITGGANAAGDIYFATTGAFSISAFSGNVTTNSTGQTIELAADSWDIDGASIGDANDSLVLTALTGGFTGVGTLSATAVALNAVGAQDINVTTDAATVAASSGGGIININSIYTGGDLVVGSVGTVTGISTTDNNITLTSTDASIDIQQEINAGTGSVGLTTLETVPGVYDIGGVANVIASGGIAVNSDNAINLNTTSGGGAVSLINHDTGSVTVTDSGAVQLGTVSVGSGSFAINAGGAITQSSALTIAGTSSFNAGANAITLDNIGNDFTGAVSLSNSGANDVTVTDINVIDLGTVTVGTGTLTVNATSITDSGTQTVDGNAIFNVANLGNITLNDAGNAYNAGVIFASAGTLSSVTFLDTTAYDVQAGGLTVGALNITAAGISQTGDLIVTGAATFNAGANTITLSNASNDFSGAVSLNNSGANAVAITDVNGIVLGASSVGNGGFTVNATGNISQGGALNVAGASSFDAGTGVITLNAANDFGGAVSLASSAAAPATNSVTDSNAIDLGTINVAGALTVLAGTDITDSGTQTVGGAASFNVGNGGNITLDDASNAYASTVSFNSAGTLNNVTFVDTTALDLQASTIGGNLDVTGAGITQSGILNITGTSSFTAGANAITLNLGNNFVGAVSLSNSGANAVSITDINAIQLGTVNVGSGSFNVNANGAITQNSALTIVGASSFSAGANAITLDNASNDFTGAVSLFNSNANNVVLTDGNAIQLGTISVGTGSFTVNASGAITQNSALVIAGAASFSAGANDITLDNASNNFNSVAVTSANNVILYDNSGGIGVAASTVTGDYTLTSVGSITSLGTLSAANANLLVTGTGNSIGTSGTPLAIDLSGNLTATASNGSGSIYISDAGDLGVASINASTGNVELSAVGVITDAAGADTVVDIIANNLTFDSTAGAGVDATDALNLQVAGLTITNSTGDFFLTEANALTLRDVTVGSIDLFAGGALTVRGNVTTLTGDLKLGSAGTLSVFVGESFVTGAVYNPNATNPALEAYICSVIGGCDQSYYSDRVTSVTPRTYSDGVTLDSSAGGDIVLMSNNIDILIAGEPNHYSSYQTVGNGLLPSGSLDWYVYEDIYPVAATLNAGTNSVIFDTYTAANTLTVGSGTSILSTAEIGRISAAGSVQFGTLANTGGVRLTSSINMATLIAPTADALLVTSGDVTTASSAYVITADNVSINAATGIGVTDNTGNGSVATALRISSSSISATNTTSGDIFLSFFGDAILGGGGQAIDNQAVDRTIGISATGNLTIGDNFSVAGLGTITLDAGGTITRTAGTITANTLNLGSGSTTSIGASGTPIITDVNYLNVTAAGDVFVDNNSATAAQLTGSAANITFVQSGAGDLALGALVASGAIDITTTSSNINGVVLPGIPDPVPQYVKANDIIVVSNGSIGAGVPLYVDAANSLSLTTNGSGAAGSIYVGSKTAMTLSGLTTNNGDTSTVIGLEAPSFTIDSPIGDGTGNLLLNASNGSITLNASLNYIDLYLGATNGGITQSAGTITATQLLIRSDNTVDLPGSNDVDILAANVVNPGQNFTFNDVDDLNLAQITGSGPLVTTSGITTNIGAISLNTGGALTQTALGVIAGGALTTVTDGGTVLNSATNAVTSFSGTDTTFDILLADSGALNVTGISTAGNVTLVTDSLTQSSVINADQLTTSTTAGSNLNLINTVNGYSATNTTSGNIVLNDNVGLLTLGGISQSGGGDITITNTGAIAQSAAISGALLNVTASGGVDLSNASNVLSGFNGTNLGGGDILVIDTTALDIVSASTAGNISLSADSLSDSGVISASQLTTNTANGSVLDNTHTVNSYVATNTTSGDIVLNDNVGLLTLGGISQSGGGDITITNTGAIAQSAAISGALLNVTASGGVDLSNASNVLSGFNGTNLGGGDILVVDTTALDIVSASTAGNISLSADSLSDSGVISASQLTTNTANGSVLDNTHTVNSYVATNTTSGDIVLNDNVGLLTLGGISQSGGGDITITNTGAIAQSAAISGALLNVTASGGIDLSNASNDLTGFNGTDLGGGNILVVDATALDIVGISTTGTVGLTTDSLSDSGAISASQLTTNTANGSVLDNTHTVNSYVATNTTSGDIVLNDNVGLLTLGGISQSGGGDIIITNTGAIAQSATISGALLTTTSSGGTTLGNAGNNLTDFNGTDLSGGNILIVDTGGLDITGISTTGNIDLTAGSLSQSGAINGNLLTTSTAGGSILNDTTNSVASYTGTDTAGGNIELANTGAALSLGTVSTAGSITITSTGNINQIDNIASTGGNNISVTSSAGSINMVNGLKTTTTGGNISYHASGDVDLSLLDAASGTQANVGTVTVISDNGDILSTDLINASVRGDIVNINAANNIGQDEFYAFVLSSDIQGQVTLDYLGNAYITTAPNLITLNILDRGTGLINSGAARSAGTQRSQSSGLEDVGFIDLALFSDINLFVIDGVGIALPADQSDEAPVPGNIPVLDEDKRKKKKPSGVNVSVLMH